jgi:S1-C subfamily serine protease
MVAQLTHAPGEVGVGDVSVGQRSNDAGLREGDIIVSFGGAVTTRVESLHTLLTADQIGQSVEVRLLRGVELESLRVIPQEMPSPPAE